MSNKPPLKKLSSRASKREKRSYINQLIQWIYPDEEPQDLLKVYAEQKELSEWLRDLLVEFRPSKTKDLDYLPLSWLLEADGSSHDVWVDTLHNKCQEEGVELISGRTVVALLNEMKKELGPEPEKAIVLYNRDGYEVVKLREMTQGELDHCIQTLQNHIRDEEAENVRIKAQSQVALNHDVLHRLVEKVGRDRAIEILEDEVEALKEVER